MPRKFFDKIKIFWYNICRKNKVFGGKSWGNTMNGFCPTTYKIMISIAKENASRKIDTLGRVSIPKGMRDRLVIAEGDEVEFFTITDDDGIQYVGMSNQTRCNNIKYERAAAVLQELGCTIPEALQAHLS